MNDLNIINGILVRPEGTFQGALGIKDGKISKVYRDGVPADEAAETIDAQGKLIFPGMIDTHVHIRGGVLSHREDFVSGTQCAAAGGVTTFLEMPVANPPASTPEVFQKREEEAAANAYVDFCLYGGAGNDNLDQIASLAGKGAVAYKTFLMPPVPGREKEFYGLCSETYEALKAVMGIVAPTGLPLAIHSENNDIVAKETARVMAEGKNGLKAFTEARPKSAEITAVQRVIEAARVTGCKVIVCHVSTVEAAKLIIEAQREGVDIHGETCPHYIMFDVDAEADKGVFARMKPPLRDRANVDELCKLYRDGVFEATGSDHAPYLKEEKLKNGNDIWKTFDGLCGLELSLPLLLNLVEAGKLTYELIARNFSESCAKLFNIPGKGRLEEGNDADLVIVSKNQVPEKIELNKLHSKAWEAAGLYEGIPLYYKVETTMVRGKQVFSNGKFMVDAGYGKFVRPVR